MPFPELDSYKKKDQEVARLLTDLEAYLTEILNRPPLEVSTFYNSSAHDINPLWVARKLGISKQRAYALLYICDEAGIITPRFDVYCPETEEFLASFPSRQALPLKIECEFHDFIVEHEIDEYLVQLFFQFSPNIIGRAFKLAV
jgi:hypothetical protein